MLTKSDLTQIKKILREEIEVESESTRVQLKSEMRTSRMRIQTDIHGLSDRAKNLEIAVRKVQKDIDNLKKGQKRIEKKLDETVDFLDRENLKTLRRVERVERRLKLTLP